MAATGQPGPAALPPGVDHKQVPDKGLEEAKALLAGSAPVSPSTGPVVTLELEQSGHLLRFFSVTARPEMATVVAVAGLHLETSSRSTSELRASCECRSAHGAHHRGMGSRSDPVAGSSAGHGDGRAENGDLGAGLIRP